MRFGVLLGPFGLISFSVPSVAELILLTFLLHVLEDDEHRDDSTLIGPKKD